MAETIKCWCGAIALHRIKEIDLLETELQDTGHPLVASHIDPPSLTAYLCEEHFRIAMGLHIDKPNNPPHNPVPMRDVSKCDHAYIRVFG